jgi:hypothetical protein
MDRDERIKDYEENEKKCLDFIPNTYVGRKLKEKGFEYYSCDEANDIFCKSIVHTDSKDLLGIFRYEGDDKDLGEITINQGNYYRGFFEPIWINLSTEEKCLLSYWMVKSLCKEKGLPDIKVSFVCKDHLNTGMQTYGYALSQKKLIYINIDRILEDDNPYLLINTIAHEMTHINQYYNIYLKQRSMKINAYNTLYNKAIITAIAVNDYIALNNQNMDNMKIGALYSTQPEEYGAQSVGVREILKIKRANEEFFGKLPIIDKNVLDTIYYSMFSYGIENNKLEFIDGFKLNEEFLHNKKNLIDRITVLKDMDILAFYGAKLNKKEIEDLSNDIKLPKNQRDEYKTLAKNYDILIKEINDEISYLNTNLQSIINTGKVIKGFNYKLLNLTNTEKVPRINKLNPTKHNEIGEATKLFLKNKKKILKDIYSHEDTEKSKIS